MIEFDKVTTRGGDRGDSSLFNGERRRKDDLLFDAMGNVDETNSWLGMVRSGLTDSNTREYVYACQQILFKIGAQIATPRHDRLYSQIRTVDAADVEWLEGVQRKLMEKVTFGPAFVTPGESELGAKVDLARTVTRRAERTVVACIRDRHMDHLVLCQKFLNRLSDFLFVLSRAVEDEIIR